VVVYYCTVTQTLLLTDTQTLVLTDIVFTGQHTHSPIEVATNKLIDFLLGLGMEVLELVKGTKLLHI